MPAGMITVSPHFRGWRLSAPITPEWREFAFNAKEETSSFGETLSNSAFAVSGFDKAKATVNTVTKLRLFGHRRSFTWIALNIVAVPPSPIGLVYTLYSNVNPCFRGALIDSDELVRGAGLPLGGCAAGSTSHRRPTRPPPRKARGSDEGPSGNTDDAARKTRRWLDGLHDVAEAALPLPPATPGSLAHVYHQEPRLSGNSAQFRRFSRVTI